jgi:hypothetical protein
MCDYLLRQTTLLSSTNLEGYVITDQPNICFKCVPQNISVQFMQICSLFTTAVKVLQWI